MLPNGTLLASDLIFRVARVPLTVERAISAIDNKHTTPSAAALHPHPLFPRSGKFHSCWEKACWYGWESAKRVVLEGA